MNSSLCHGWISHRRLTPGEHAFRYPIGMLYLDLAEQARLLSLSPLLRASRLAPLCWREADYLPAWTRRGIPLAQAVRELLREALGEAPRGAIYLLTQPRSWGVSFNPVSFYFCHEEDGSLAAILCEVRNTPWRERYHYVLPAAPGQPHTFEVAKAFHVSPFMPREMTYRMRFTVQGAQIRVQMENWRDGLKVFEADLALQRRALDGASVRRHLVAFPWVSLRTLIAIYWQALRLLLKRTPLHQHRAGDPGLGLGHIAREEPVHAKSNADC